MPPLAPHVSRAVDSPIAHEVEPGAARLRLPPPRPDAARGAPQPAPVACSRSGSTRGCAARAATSWRSTSSDGLGQDYSIIDVIRQPTIEEPAEQVAQYGTNELDPKALAFVCDAIGRYYADADGIEALAAIETNNHGLATQDTLQLHLGYGHFYVWEYADAATPERRYSTRIGWLTSPRTRPLLLASFYGAVTTFDPITHAARLRPQLARSPGGSCATSSPRRQSAKPKPRAGSTTTA